MLTCVALLMTMHITHTTLKYTIFVSLLLIETTDKFLYEFVDMGDELVA